MIRSQMTGSNHIATSPSFVLRSARLNRGLSIRQAAHAIGVAQQTFRRLEEGEPIHPASAKKVADFFGVQVTDLMPGVHGPERSAAA
jgi:transcriptional regulator with XRE-family HTH domain